MKDTSMKCTRWQLQRRRRMSASSSQTQRRWALIGVPAMMLFFVFYAHAQTAILPPIGGSGGSQFIARCADNELLTGFELRAGDDIDAIRPLCVAAFGPGETSLVQLTRGSGLITTGKNAVGLDVLKLGDGWYGGTGGHLANVICPTDTPIVTGMYIRAEGVHTITVNNIHLFCGVAATTQNPTEFPSAVFDAPLAKSSLDLFTENIVHDTQATQHCPAGLVGVGINGRSGVWVDAMGLICGEPKLTPKPVVLGRVQSTTPAGPAVSICERAREARARNSPAAPSLESQCRAASKKPPVVLGRVQGTPTGPPRSICDAAQDARARNSPAAPSLEAQCRTYLAAKGAAIAETDPELAKARAIEEDASYRQGFDIATGIFGDPALGAQGNTAVGPGSQRIRDSLSAVGQRGFDASVQLHLSRKYK